MTTNTELARAHGAAPVVITSTGHLYDADNQTPTHWCMTSKQLDAYTQAIAAQAVQAVPGWQWVPVEPTLNMTEAGCPCGEVIDHFDMRAAYRAMLAAAPQPPVKQAVLTEKEIKGVLRNLQSNPDLFVNPVTFARAIEAAHNIHPAATLGTDAESEYVTLHTKGGKRLTEDEIADFVLSRKAPSTEGGGV